MLKAREGVRPGLRARLAFGVLNILGGALPFCPGPFRSGPVRPSASLRNGPGGGVLVGFIDLASQPGER